MKEAPLARMNRLNNSRQRSAYAAASAAAGLRVKNVDDVAARQ